MKTVHMLLAAAAALTVGSAAEATVVVRASTPYGFTAYPADFGSPITFDAGGNSGYTLSGSFVIRSGSDGGSAAPATSATTFDTTNYLSVSPQNATMTGFGNQRQMTLYWGSIDAFNSIEFFNGNTSIGTINGAMASINPNGDQDSNVTNRRVTILADQLFNRIVFRTGQDAFEIDNIAFSTAVPEPATWAMMLVGFGLTGAALRRRRTAVRFATC